MADVQCTAVVPDSCARSKRKRKGGGQWTRASNACERCRRLKIRCEVDRPCYQCQHARHSCRPTSQARSTGVTKYYHRSTNTRGQHPRQPILDCVTFNGPSGNFDIDSSDSSPRALDDPTTHFTGSHPSHPTILPILNESSEKRWAGDSSFIASSKRLSEIEPLLRPSKPRTGLPGTDDQNTEIRPPSAPFVEPTSCGFPEESKSFESLSAFLDGVHCVFSFVHAGLCRHFFEEIYKHGLGAVDEVNQAAHIAILALGRLSSLPRHDTDILGQEVSRIEHLFDLAQGAAYHAVERASIPALVMLQALTLYQLASGRYAVAWATFSLCVRQAQAIGLHRETPEWKMSESLRQGRRSTWVNIYFLDTLLSACYGRPPAIADEHCNSLLPSVCLDDLKTVPFESLGDPSASMSLKNIYHASPSRMQFHLLKFHLCTIIKTVLKELSLLPPDSPRAKNNRQKWDIAQSVMGDLHELRACIPPHLQIINLDNSREATYKQQSAFLNILINYTIILVHRPLLGSHISYPNNYAPSDKVEIARVNHARDACYEAASGICSMVSGIRKDNLSLAVHLILSALGVYSSAAELIALYAITRTLASSHEARDAYRDLGCLIRLLTWLQKHWPLGIPDCAILRELVQVVRDKVEIGSRMPTPEPSTVDKQPYAVGPETEANQGQDQEHAPQLLQPCINDDIDLQSDLDLQWMDEFLALGNSMAPADSHTQRHEQATTLDDDLFGWIYITE